jgi:NAD(P)-dependent dehydrogenase (short-subunit alcohol dehydrogenase family)
MLINNSSGVYFLQKKVRGIKQIQDFEAFEGPAGGLYGARTGAVYTASKHAVVVFTKNTGYMYATNGIRCNAIASGGVETNISSSMTGVNQFRMGRIQRGLALNPWVGKPDEIANIPLFLASEESSSVEGTVIIGGAGWTAY